MSTCINLKKGWKPTVNLQYTVLHLTTGLCYVGVIDLVKHCNNLGRHLNLHSLNELYALIYKIAWRLIQKTSYHSKIPQVGQIILRALSYKSPFESTYNSICSTFYGLNLYRADPHYSRNIEYDRKTNLRETVTIQ